MKRISIKGKVTIWITIFMIMISLLSLFVLVRYMSKTVWTEAEMILREEVKEFEDEIEIFSDGGYEIDVDSYHENQVIFSIYNNEGQLLSGSVPSVFPVNTTLKNGVVQKIQSEGKAYLTYDVAIDIGNGEYLWLRGILYTSLISSAEKGLITLIAVMLPVLVIAAASGGYFITKRAFAPVEEISRTAEEVSGSGDLSKRVIVEKADKEIYELAQVFNQMMDSVEQAFEKEKQFTADASHELRTPISVILSESEYALLPDIEEEERREALQVIEGQARKMSSMISQMLAIARNQKEKIVWMPIPISEVVQVVAEEFTPKAEEKRMKLHSEIAEDIYVSGEQSALIRIFTNLIENAVFYGKKGGNIWIRLWAANGLVKCSIKDDGIGIAKENQEKIFHRFFRVDKVRTSEAEVHSGLGLFMVKMLVEDLNGTIQVNSELGQGAEFIVTFPIKKC